MNQIEMAMGYLRWLVNERKGRESDLSDDYLDWWYSPNERRYLK
jgi:hypothetical protein